MEKQLLLDYRLFLGYSVRLNELNLAQQDELHEARMRLETTSPKVLLKTILQYEQSGLTPIKPLKPRYSPRNMLKNGG